jgi:hypothetical protein
LRGGAVGGGGGPAAGRLLTPRAAREAVVAQRLPLGPTVHG